MTEMAGGGGGGGGPSSSKSEENVSSAGDNYPRRMPDFLINALFPHGHEKALKQAFYNTVSILFVVFVIVVLVAVYFILQPFLRPLLWAILFGSVLHPFKQRVTQRTRTWLNDLKTRRTPLAVGSINLPFKLVDFILESIVSITVQYFKLLAFILIASTSVYLVIYYFTFTHRLITFATSVFCLIASIFTYIQNSSNSLVIFTIFVAHLLLVSVWWSNSTRRILVLTSPIIWTAVVTHLVNFIGTLGLVTIVMFSFLVVTGLVASLFTSRSTLGDEVDSVTIISGNLLSLFRSISYYMKFLLPTHQVYISSSESTPTSDESAEENSRDTTDHNTDDKVTETTDNRIAVPQRRTSRSASVGANQYANFDGPMDPGSQRSNAYLYSLLWSCLLAQIWLRPRILYLLPVTLSLIGLKWCWTKFRSANFTTNRALAARQWIEVREDAFFHPFFRTIWRYLVLGDRFIIECLEKALDAICSLGIIFLVIICVLFATVFLSIQVYGESIHLVELTANLVNSTLASNPEITQLLPDGFEGADLLNDMIENLYYYGRRWLKTTIRNVLNVGDGNGGDNSNATVLVERQLLEVWDRVYHLWLIRNENNDSNQTSLTSAIHRNRQFGEYNWKRLFDALKTLNFALGFNALKENIDTVISVFDSIWSVLLGNISLLVSAVTAIVSLLLGGGTAIMNFCLNFIVFTTSLFYLLCSSGDLYKPVELVSRLMPSSQNSKSYYKLGKAVEESINGVFAATFRMTAFYGLYTWLIHTVFEMKLTYIPAVLAALFGAVPFLGAYWASLPAVVELWLIHGQPGKSVVMLVCAFLPTNFVDSAIYSEIKGAGHPYLTGLAIAGGVFYLGIEGALFGPILLCCLFVAFNMYTSICLNESQEVTPTLQDTAVMRRRPPQLHRVMSTIH